MSSPDQTPRARPIIDAAEVWIAEFVVVDDPPHGPAGGTMRLEHLFVCPPAPLEEGQLGALLAPVADEQFGKGRWIPGGFWRVPVPIEGWNRPEVWRFPMPRKVDAH